MNVYANADRLAVEAFAHHAAGRISAAREACHHALRGQPEHARSRYLLGLIALQAGQFADGIAQLKRSLRTDPGQPYAYTNLGAALNQLGRPAEALRCCERALALEPGLFAALFHRGVALRRLGHAREAVSCFEQALKACPDDLTTLNWLAKALCDLACYTRALDILQRAVRVSPYDAATWLNIGIARLQSGDCPGALEALEHSLQASPRQTAALYNRGLALLALQEPARACDAFTRALEIEPTNASALVARARAFSMRAQSANAARDLDAAYRLQPQRADVLINWAQTQLDHQRPDLAEATLAALNRALSYGAEFHVGNNMLQLAQRSAEPGAALRRFGQDPEGQQRRARAELLFLRGLALQQLQQFGQAVESYRSALELAPDLSAVRGNLSGLLMAQGRNPEALELLRQQTEPTADLRYSAGQHWHAARSCCAWDESGTERKRALLMGISERQPVCLPLVLLGVTDDASLQWQCAAAHVEHEYGQIDAPLAPARFRHDRIRVGYLSGDFRDHATAFLLTGVLEQHDRSRFDTYALSLQTRNQGRYGERCARAVEHFEQLCGLSDAEAAARIRELEIDLLIDLTGYTLGARPAILARRAAPVQINYLGYPGSLGAPYVDYLIADEYVIPPASREFYSERIVYLPDCFQANDARRAATAVPSREQCGLSPEATVLCCFNASHKLTPDLFSCWMRLLHAVPEALLWLHANNEETRDNLRQEALRRGIAPERLVFAPTAPYGEHLARLSLADLYLDTLPFNGGTTISDALWAGVPVITCSGGAFAARMGGSLLRTLGTPELVTSTAADYESLALTLLRDATALRAIRRRIQTAGSVSPLFDTARFTRCFETALEHMVQGYRDGRPAEHFSVKWQAGLAWANPS